MHAFTVNYLKRDGRRRGQLANVGFFVHQVPRLLLWCAVFGHKPVVDGTGEYKTDSPGGERYGNPHRWVVCDRCGVRGNPQGSLDPARWNIGNRYPGPWADGPLDKHGVRAAKVGHHPPGPIPFRGAVGEVGGQLVIGRVGQPHRIGWEVKVGNAGSEHVLAANIALGWLGTLYLHTSNHGQWLQRRLNPTGYESRVTSLELRTSGLEWRVWSRRDSGSRYGCDREPWWRYGEIPLRWRDKLFGRRRYSYTDVGEPVGRFVRMPEGEDHLVNLRLQRQVLGRPRLRWLHRRSWTVDWQTAGQGIPTKGPGRGRVLGSGVAVSDAAVRAGTWPSEAVCAIATRMVRDRTRYEWEPLGRATVDVEAVSA